MIWLLLVTWSELLDQAYLVTPRALEGMLNSVDSSFFRQQGFFYNFPFRVSVPFVYSLLNLTASIWKEKNDAITRHLQITKEISNQIVWGFVGGTIINQSECIVKVFYQHIFTQWSSCFSLGYSILIDLIDNGQLIQLVNTTWDTQQPHCNSMYLPAYEI